MIYEKLPVRIEASRFELVGEPHLEFTVVWDDPSDWIIEATQKPFQEIGSVFSSHMWRQLCVHTLEGIMNGKSGDYLIKGVKGELYICDADIFKQTYRLIEE